MAKCSICMKVKGKRNCKVFSGVVCALCCGTSRDETRCTGCSFYKSAAEMRRYDKTSYFSTLQMADSQELQDAGNVIEGAMCGFDLEQKHAIKDGFLKKVLERLLDHYAFDDKTPPFSDDLEREGFAFIDAAIKEDLSETEPEFLSKVIATVYRSVKRHADGLYGGREYIDFIHQHVGTRLASEIRALPKPGMPDIT